MVGHFGFSHNNGFISEPHREQLNVRISSNYWEALATIHQQRMWPAGTTVGPRRCTGWWSRDDCSKEDFCCRSSTAFRHPPTTAYSAPSYLLLCWCCSTTTDLQQLTCQHIVGWVRAAIVRFNPATIRPIHASFLRHTNPLHSRRDRDRKCSFIAKERR